mgnify:CR=1 FL=1
MLFRSLEFLGDAILNFVAGEALFERFPQAREGQLSRLRARLVKGETLAVLARGFELGEYLRLGSGELKSGGFRRESILADALEALIGAIYLDAGMEAARDRVLAWLASEFETLTLVDTNKDPKTRLQELQELLYANQTHSLLIILQGMDTARKDGTIKHVMSGVNPQGCQVFAFKRPSAEELDHDFLWRVKREVPKAGWIAVFDRSHYEDVVMPHVYGTYPEDVWRARYDQINDFERELAASGCAILKIFLVVSQEEQKKHFLGRLDDPTKFWKFDISDLEARDRWDEYMFAWQEVFEKTSTAAAPWYLVPADNRWYSRAVVSELLRTTLKNMNMTWPPLEPEVDPDEVRRRLA